jgi:hypothetical protein
MKHIYVRKHRKHHVVALHCPSPAQNAAGLLRVVKLAADRERMRTPSSGHL